MAAVDNIITSVQQSQPQHVLNPELLTTVHLDLRGRRFHVDRDTLMNLPESVLLCLFPNGLVLSRVAGAGGSQWGDGTENEEDEYLYVVDVSVWSASPLAPVTTSSETPPPLFDICILMKQRDCDYTVRPRLLHVRR